MNTSTSIRTWVYYTVALAVVVGVVVLGGIVQRAEAVQAPDKNPCVSRSEVVQLRHHVSPRTGWSVPKVRRVTETPGQLVDNQLATVISYPTCDPSDHLRLVAYFTGDHLVSLSTVTDLG